MLTVLWIVVAILLAALLTSWIAFTATRLDRLHARIDAAQAALDAQLVRRAAAAQHLADSAVDSPAGTAPSLPEALGTRLATAAAAALDVGPERREAAENVLGRTVAELAEHHDRVPPELDPVVHELADCAVRVVIARRFYNDAVRDTRTLRGRRMPRLLHLAGHREMPQYFDIDDSSPWVDQDGTAPALSLHPHPVPGGSI